MPIQTPIAPPNYSQLLTPKPQPTVSGSSLIGGAVKGVGNVIGGVLNSIKPLPQVQGTYQAPFVISGLKANQPGGTNNSSTNTIKDTYTAPVKQQQATGGANQVSSYKGIKITPGTDSDVAAQIKAIDIAQGGATGGSTGTQNTSTSPVQTGTTASGTPIMTGTFGPGTPQNQGAGASQLSNPTQQTQTYTDANGNTIDANGNIINLSQNTQNQINSGSQNAASSNNGGQTSFPGLVGGLATTAGGNLGIGQNAQNITQGYANQINPILKEATGQALGEASTGPFQVGEGNAAATTNAAGNLIQGLTSQEQQQLTGNAQQLTAQNQAQSGLNNAASLVQPSANFPFVFNPATGSFTNAGGGVVSADQAAQAVNSGSMTYDQAKSSLGYLGTSAEAQLQSAILKANPNANIANLQAQGSASQQNTQTQGTAQTDIAKTGLGTATQTYTTANTFNNTASNQAKTLQNILSSTGINSGVPAYNQSINSLQNQLGGTNYSQFITALNELQNSYSQLLSTGGGTPSQQDATALATLDPTKSAAQINASIQTLQEDTYDKLTSLYGNVQTYQNLLNTGGSTNTNGNTNTTAPAGFGWNGQ
jgi:hypothetical protein